MARSERPNPETHATWAAYYDIVISEGFSAEQAFRELLIHGYKPYQPRGEREEAKDGS